MPEFYRWIIPISMGAVLIVLLMGLGNMLRGGSGNTSQMLMRWRVALQFIAVVIMMAVLYFKSGS